MANPLAIPSPKKDTSFEGRQTMNELFPNLARKFFRAYRNGPIRIGHSFIRRLLDPVLGKRQIITLRSGLKLDLDLTKGNQNAIFWNDGDGGLYLDWAIRELIPIGGLLVDCGAHCGLIGLQGHQYRLAKVIFIEAHPRLAKTISDNIRLNRFESDCEIIEAAVSDSSGQIPFYENLLHDGSHSTRPDLDTKMQLLGNVKSIALKDLFAERNLGKVHFLKIDVEGNELNVLKGLGDMLTPSKVEVLYIEMLQNQDAIISYMQAKGYMGFVCKYFKRQTIQQIRCIYGKGGSVCIFEPLKAGFTPNRDVLWCGKNSAPADFLNRLHLNSPH